METVCFCPVPDRAHYPPFLPTSSQGFRPSSSSSEPMLMVWFAQTTPHRLRDNVDMESAVSRSCTTSASLTSRALRRVAPAPPPMAHLFSDCSHCTQSLLRWLGRNQAPSQRNLSSVIPVKVEGRHFSRVRRDDIMARFYGVPRWGNLGRA